MAKTDTVGCSHTDLSRAIVTWFVTWSGMEVERMEPLCPDCIEKHFDVADTPLGDPIYIPKESI